MKAKNYADKLNIMVITHPFSGMVGQTILANLVDVLVPISKELTVISGDFSYDPDKKVRIFKVGPITTEESFPVWVGKQIRAQLMTSYYLVKASRRFDIAFFFLGGRVLILPVLIAKLLQKKIVVVATGSSSGATWGTYVNKFFGLGKSLVPKAAKILERLCFSLADQVAVESPSAIDFLELGKYKSKLVINGARYKDTNLFKINRGLNERQNLVGFIGRFSAAKAILNFARAIPLVLEHRDDIEFLMGGGGPLLDELKRELKSNNCYKKVKLTGWIPHEELPGYMNELKLIVLPSYSEGLPGIVEEGMACGAIVIATPVGGIPDLVKDEKTGFILEDNSPECIAKTIIKALSHPNLNEIVKNARKLIEDEYAYDVMVEKYRESLSRLKRG